MVFHSKTKIHSSWTLFSFVATLIALFLLGIIFFYQKVNASVLSVTHTPSSGVKSVANNHTVSFTTVNAVPANGFIIVLFSDGFTFQSGIDYTDVDFIVDGSQRALSASNSSVSDGATFGSYKMQINLNNITGVSAAAQVEIRIGTHATEGSVGDKQVVNPGTAGNGSINVDTNTPISAGMSLIDSGGASMTITNTPGVNIVEVGGSTAVSEAGVWDTYYVSLNSQPSSNVTVTITPDAQLTTNKSSLTFTSSNWSSQQSVSVFAANDSVIEGNHTGTVSHAVTSSDTNYNGLAANGVSATIT